MARYKYQDPSQGLFLNIYLKDQLLVGTFEWTLDYLIDRADFSLFDLQYDNDTAGASAYHPSALLKIIFYCYSQGIITSRPIEKAAKTNIVVKALAADAEPDHDTIAHFISSNSDAVQDLFAQILLPCSEVEQHKKLDNDPSAKKKQKPFKKTLGDDDERRKRHIERIENKMAKLEAFLETAEPRLGGSGNEVQSNITDPESARIKGPHGYIQGYNGIGSRGHGVFF